MRIETLTRYAVALALLITGCSRTQPKTLIQGTIGNAVASVAQEVKQETVIALSQADVSACNHERPIVHDPALEVREEPEKEKYVDKKVTADMVPGEQRYIWQVVKDDDGKLYVGRYITGYLKPSDDEYGSSTIRVLRVDKGFLLDCTSKLYIWLNHDGPSSHREESKDLIPIIGFIQGVRK